MEKRCFCLGVTDAKLCVVLTKCDQDKTCDDDEMWIPFDWNEMYKGPCICAPRLLNALNSPAGAVLCSFVSFCVKCLYSISVALMIFGIYKWKYRKSK